MASWYSRNPSAFKPVSARREGATLRRFSRPTGRNLRPLTTSCKQFLRQFCNHFRSPVTRRVPLEFRATKSTAIRPIVNSGDSHDPAQAWLLNEAPKTAPYCGRKMRLRTNGSGACSRSRPQRGAFCPACRWKCPIRTTMIPRLVDAVMKRPRGHGGGLPQSSDASSSVSARSSSWEPLPLPICS